MLIFRLVLLSLARGSGLRGPLLKEPQCGNIGKQIESTLNCRNSLFWPPGVKATANFNFPVYGYYWCIYAVQTCPLSLAWLLPVYMQYRPAGVVSGNSVYSDHFSGSHASWNHCIDGHSLKREDNSMRFYAHFKQEMPCWEHTNFSRRRHKGRVRNDVLVGLLHWLVEDHSHKTITG